MSEPEVVVLCGGISDERDVSLVSGQAVYTALQGSFSARLQVLDAPALAAGLDASRCVIFPALHGEFGEDGQLQQLLEREGFAFAGSGAEASALCIHKVMTKRRVAQRGVPVLEDVAFEAAKKPSAAEVVQALGTDLVLKPVNHGSSRGVVFTDGLDALETALKATKQGDWLVEPRVRGRELSVGVLQGKALGVVEITPESGAYDYHHKYTAGATQYQAPAKLSDAQTLAVQQAAEAAFGACGCRDFARADFMLGDDDTLAFLEINTIPGLTPTSLLPRSAACNGYAFTQLVRTMLAPALERFTRREAVGHVV
ncbi:MAG: D-alanine--D-alanine ligase [Opitutales bacterium]